MYDPIIVEYFEHYSVFLDIKSYFRTLQSLIETKNRLGRQFYIALLMTTRLHLINRYILLIHHELVIIHVTKNNNNHYLYMISIYNLYSMCVLVILSTTKALIMNKGIHLDLTMEYLCLTIISCLMSGIRGILYLWWVWRSRIDMIL